MNIFTRALLFLKRNRLKTAVLGLSTLTMGILIFTITTATAGVDKLVNDQLEKFAPTVSIDLDYETLYNDNGSTEIKMSEVNSSLSKEQINMVEQSEYWLGTINRSSFEFIINPNNGLEVFTPTDIPYAGEQTAEDQGVSNFMTSVQGVNTPDNFIDQESYVYDYQFSEKELSSNANVIILNDQYMEYNNLKVGDKISLGSSIEPAYNLTQADLESSDITWQDYEIVGSYTYTPTSSDISEAKKYAGQDNPNMMLYYNYNQVYMPITTMTELKATLAESYLEVNNITEDEILFNDPTYQDYAMLEPSVYTTFKYDDIKNKDAFVTDVKEALKDKPYVTVSDDSNVFLWQYGVLGTLSEYSFIILVATIFVSSIFLSFVIILFIRDRQKEIGILIALGEKKKNIYLQIILELAILVVIGFVIAMPIGYFIAVSQVAEIPFTLWSVVLLFLVGFLITIFATLIPLLYMLKLSPKKILM